MRAPRRRRDRQGGTTPFPHPRPPWHRTPARALATLLVAAGCLFSCVEAALAHGEPAGLSDWGGFSRAISRCQRRIGGAGLACAVRAWEVRRACDAALAEGGSCDEAAAGDRIRAAQTNARLAVNQPDACTFLEVQNLRFIDLFEALTDVTRVCRDAEVRLTHLVFESEPSGAAQETSRACRHAASDAAASLFHFSLRLRTRALDRIAASALPLQRKEALLSASASRIAWARSALRALVEGRCPAADFQALYGRTLDAFLTEVSNQADCSVAGTYAQAAIRCPTAVCGNGVVEPGEQCDDGNDDDGDGCAGCFAAVSGLGSRLAD
jgi:cysteine-rich repeat protein